MSEVIRVTIDSEVTGAERSERARAAREITGVLAGVLVSHCTGRVRSVPGGVEFDARAPGFRGRVRVTERPGEPGAYDVWRGYDLSSGEERAVEQVVVQWEDLPGILDPRPLSGDG